MRKALLLFIFCFFMTPLKAGNKDGEAFVKKISGEIIALLQSSAADREESFVALLNKYANMRRISRFTLGQYARRFSDDDLEEYQKVFTRYIVRIYNTRLKEYKDEKIVINGSQQKTRNIIVTSKIILKAQEPLPVDWWLIAEKDGTITLFDLRVVGIWMAQEQRASIGAFLSSNNGNAKKLIAHLQEKLS
ncbi:MAG: MlaC/ttg2D family ABC transporter substrate-binding protein [Parvibaculales bacterium]